MRMKRLLSLMLAVLMFASMTISVSAVSKVYYLQDFSAYSDVTGVLAGMYGAISGTFQNKVTDAIAKMNETGKQMLYLSTNGGGLSKTQSTLTTDENGVNWFGFHSLEANSAKNGNFVIVPENTWDYTSETGKNEIYIISYDVKLNPQDVIKDNEKVDITSSQRTDVATMWTDGVSANTTDTMVQHARTMPTDTRHPSTSTQQVWALVNHDKNWYSNQMVELIANQPHKIATGYYYGENGEGVAYTYPNKSTAIDGNLIRSTTSQLAGVNNTMPKLGGLNFTYGYPVGTAITNIKMYTVDGGEEGFNVSVVNENVNTIDKIRVKFSHPIYESTFVPADVAVQKVGSPALSSAAFDVTEVKTVIDNETKEIYSYFDISFKFGLEPAADYQVVVPNTVKNEIGFELINNIAEFTTLNPTNSVASLLVGAGLAGESTSSNFVAGMNNFTATAAAGSARAFLLIGIYEGSDLVNYSFATVNENESVSLAADIQSGMTVKALSCGDLVNLTALSSVVNMTEATE